MARVVNIAFIICLNWFIKSMDDPSVFCNKYRLTWIILKVKRIPLTKITKIIEKQVEM